MQTTVDWLQEALSLHLTFEQKVQFEGLFQQAKEMERDQIIDAHDAAYIAMNLCFRGFDRSVEYYEKTYGNCPEVPDGSFSRHQEDDETNL